MSDRDKRPRPERPGDRAERLAAALRANLRRRKAQARGRHDRPPALGQDENRPPAPHSESKKE